MKKLVPYRVENIVRKGEIACCKQFLLFSQCFPKLLPTAINNASLKVHDVVFVFLTKGIIRVDRLYEYLQRVFSAILSRA